MATGGSSPTRLYTRTGDRGETGLIGGARVAKDSPRIRAFGTFDELGAHLGLAAASLPPNAQTLYALLTRLQHELFIAQSELAAPAGGAGPPHRIAARHVRRLEEDIDRASASIPPVRSFVLPRGHLAGASLHVARAVSRRAERELWTLHREEPQSEALLKWANRLSDLLFALALSVNETEGFAEIAPDYSV